MSSFIWQAGGDFVKEESGKFSASLNTPEVAEAMTFMRTMMCEKSPSRAQLTPPPPTLSSFRSGQSGMFFSGPYHIALFDKDPGKDNFEVVPVVGPKGEATLAEGTTVFMMKSSQQKEAARKFIEFDLPEGRRSAWVKAVSIFRWCVCRLTRTSTLRTFIRMRAGKPSPGSITSRDATCRKSQLDAGASGGAEGFNRILPTATAISPPG